MLPVERERPPLVVLGPVNIHPAPGPEYVELMYQSASTPSLTVMVDLGPARAWLCGQCSKRVPYVDPPDRHLLPVLMHLLGTWAW